MEFGFNWQRRGGAGVFLCRQLEPLEAMQGGGKLAWERASFLPYSVEGSTRGRTRAEQEAERGVWVRVLRRHHCPYPALLCPSPKQAILKTFRGLSQLARSKLLGPCRSWQRGRGNYRKLWGLFGGLLGFSEICGVKQGLPFTKERVFTASLVHP